MAQLSFPNDVIIRSSVSGNVMDLNVDWKEPYLGDRPSEYIVLLRDGDGNRIKGSREVVSADEELRITHTGLPADKPVRVCIRSKDGKRKGKWYAYLVVPGEQPPTLPMNHYMEQVPAGDPTPDDAIGEPTRHVKMINNRWQRFLPHQSHVANRMYFWWNELAKAEDELQAAEAMFEDWKEDNPDAPMDHPLYKHKFEIAQQAVTNIRAKIAVKQAEAEAEANSLYPPENLTEEQTRWVERPVRRATNV